MATDSVLHIEMERSIALHSASPGYNLIPLHSPRAFSHTASKTFRHTSNYSIILFKEFLNIITVFSTLIADLTGLYHTLDVILRLTV